MAEPLSREPGFAIARARVTPADHCRPDRAAMLKALFWIVVTIDLAVLMLFFLLGLAAAPSSRTSAGAVAAYMLVVPGIVLIGCIVLFVRSTSPVGRVAALLLAASPLLLAAGTRAIAGAKLRTATNAEGQLTYYRAGPLRDIAEAIARNDSATVAALAPGVEINSRGFGGTTLLTLALRRLREPPHDVGVLRALLSAGADPNLDNGETPLELAIQASRTAGPEPVRMLLEAGADPNAKGQFGTPAFFLGAGRPISREVLDALLEQGANLEARDSNGLTIVFHAATSANWRAVLLLLERGTVWKDLRSSTGQTFREMVESYARVYGDTGGVAEVVEYLKRH
jgi:hypothetical protein